MSKRRVEHFRLQLCGGQRPFFHLYQGGAGRFISIGAEDGVRITSLTVGTWMVVKYREGEEVLLDTLRGAVFNIPYGRGEPIEITSLGAAHIALVLEEEW